MQAVGISSRRRCSLKKKVRVPPAICKPLFQDSHLICLNHWGQKSDGKLSSHSLTFPQALALQLPGVHQAQLCIHCLPLLQLHKAISTPEGGLHAPSCHPAHAILSFPARLSWATPIHQSEPSPNTASSGKVYLTTDKSVSLLYILVTFLVSPLHSPD